MSKELYVQVSLLSGLENLKKEVRRGDFSSFLEAEETRFLHEMTDKVDEEFTDVRFLIFSSAYSKWSKSITQETLKGVIEDMLELTHMETRNSNNYAEDVQKILSLRIKDLLDDMKKWDKEGVTNESEGN